MQNFKLLPKTCTLCYHKNAANYLQLDPSKLTIVFVIRFNLPSLKISPTMSPSTRLTFNNNRNTKGVWKTFLFRPLGFSPGMCYITKPSVPALLFLLLPIFPTRCPNVFFDCCRSSLHAVQRPSLSTVRLEGEEGYEEIRGENEMLQQCSHPNVVRYFGSYQGEEYLWIVMEYCGGGSVADLMNVTEETLDEPQTAFICREALKGLAYLHSIQKVHRDIKGGNILLTDQGEVKLGP